MKVELKNVKINLEFSDETIMFKGDLFIDGKKVCSCENDGRGGSTFVHPYPNMKDKLNEFEDYCETLPPIVFTDNNGKVHTWKVSVEEYVDDLLDKIVNEKELKKFQKKLEKDCLKGICYGNGTTQYNTITWKGQTIESLLRHPQGSVVIRKKLSELILKGENILNKNIPENLYPKF